jgi:Putative DNA-binding domain
MSAASKRSPGARSSAPDLSQPFSEESLRLLIAVGESNRVEFKREWYDLQHKDGKALMAKDVLALANIVGPEAPGFLIIGVDNQRQVVGVKEAPDPETISNIIGSYIQPPANVQCRHHRIGDLEVSVLIVSWSPARPHHSLREHSGILARDVVYVRRDRTIGTLTLPEIEVMVREKNARLGPLISQDPIQCGFVQKAESHAGNALVARVTNVTTEPVGGVDVMIDVRNTRNPELCYRARKLGNAALQPGESREVELRLGEIDFYLAIFDPATGNRTWTTVRNLGAHVGDRWLDVTLHVDYRDRDGFIRHVERRMTLDA